MKKVIGIISYLPNNDRKQGLQETLEKVARIFPDIDILIIAQCWGDFIPKCKNKLIIHKYKNKLGLMGARCKLREAFLNSDYDYLIMTDDDLVLEGQSGDHYLNFIDEHPGCATHIRECMQLQMFGISKELYSKIQMPLLENGAIFEDVFLIEVCKRLGKLFIDTESGLTENTWQGSAYQSTWWNDKHYKMKKIELATNAYIENYLKCNFS